MRVGGHEYLDLEGVAGGVPPGTEIECGCGCGASREVIARRVTYVFRGIPFVDPIGDCPKASPFHVQPPEPWPDPPRAKEVDDAGMREVVRGWDRTAPGEDHTTAYSPPPPPPPRGKENPVPRSAEVGALIAAAEGLPEAETLRKELADARETLRTGSRIADLDTRVANLKYLVKQDGEALHGRLCAIEDRLVKLVTLDGGLDSEAVMQALRRAAVVCVGDSLALQRAAAIQAFWNRFFEPSE